jgi:hypothetical protein
VLIMPAADFTLRQIATFEARARGEGPYRQPKCFFRPTAAPAASVAYQESNTMNSHVNVPSLLQPAVSSSAYLKMGILGFQGGGKTLTGAKSLIGLYKYTLNLGLHDGTKPVAMIDTEKGSDWLIPMFKQAGVPFVVAKRQAFADLLKVMDDAESSSFGLLIDSITHPWRELVESYLRKKERSYLAMDDWGYLKGEHGWKQFTDRFVNSKLHIVMAGRAGHEYENYVEDGRKKMEKVGTKMKTEGETGYEPDLLVLMEQVEDLRTGKVVHRATVQKDRSTLLDGHQFDNPDFKDFLPHIECLALGSPHVGISGTGDSQHLLKLERRDWSPVQRKIVLGELQDLLVQHAGGQTIADKQRRIALLKAHFNGCGYVEIEETMPLPDLRAGYDSLHQELEGKPSRYGSAIARDAESTDLNDSLPDTFAPLAKATATVTEMIEAPATADASVDESKWLAELTKAFGDCVDFVSFGEKQQALMAPVKSRVAPATWKKAVKLAQACVTRLTEQPGGIIAAAAE